MQKTTLIIFLILAVGYLLKQVWTFYKTIKEEIEEQEKENGKGEK